MRATEITRLTKVLGINQFVLPIVERERGVSHVKWGPLQMDENAGREFVVREFC